MRLFQQLGPQIGRADGVGFLEHQHAPGFETVDRQREGEPRQQGQKPQHGGDQIALGPVRFLRAPPTIVPRARHGAHDRGDRHANGDNAGDGIDRERR